MNESSVSEAESYAMIVSWKKRAGHAHSSPLFIVDIAGASGEVGGWNDAWWRVPCGVMCFSGVHLCSHDFVLRAPESIS